MAGRPLSQVATPEHALAPRQRPDQPAEDDRRVVAIRQAVHHPGRALRPAVAGVGDHPGERHDVEPPQLLGRLLDQQADLPVPRVISQRDRLAIRPRSPPCVLRIRYGSRATSLGVQPMPAFCVRPKRSPEGQSLSISSVSGSEPAGPSALVVTS